jgi:hypothetical protein
LKLGAPRAPRAAAQRASRAAGRQAAERLGVGLATSVCPVYPSALLVEISAGAAAAAAAAGAGAGAPGGGGPRGGQHEEWTVLSLRFTERCFSEGESPALLFHQRCDGTDCPQARRQRPPPQAPALAPPRQARALSGRTWGASFKRHTRPPPAAPASCCGPASCCATAVQRGNAGRLTVLRAATAAGCAWLSSHACWPQVAAGRHPLHTAAAAPVNGPGD